MLKTIEDVQKQQVIMVNAANFIDAAVRRLNDSGHAYVSRYWRKWFPGHSAGISAGYMMGCHTLQWKPEILIYSVSGLCFADTGHWYDPMNFKLQVVRPMPQPKDLDDFCARMSHNLATRVRFHRHQPPVGYVFQGVKPGKKKETEVFGSR